MNNRKRKPEKELQSDIAGKQMNTSELFVPYDIKQWRKFMN